MTQPWRIEGEYLEACNCEVLCPCLLGPRNARGGALARPTEGHCAVPMAFAIARGQMGAVDLAGLAAAILIWTPGPMGEGGWTAGAYVDERGAPEQRQALEAIFTGRAGGVLGHVEALVARRLPTRVAPIEVGAAGRRRWARIPGILEMEIEGIAGRQGDAEVWLDNVRHPVSSRLAAARGLGVSYQDHGLGWSHAGRNGHYAGFAWTGP